MNHKTKERFLYYANETKNANSLENHKYALGVVVGIRLALQLEEIITKAENEETLELLTNANDSYWEKAKADFESAHKRIF